MIHKLAAWMASIFVSYGVSTEENSDIYAYACEAIIFTITSILIGLVVSLLFGRVIEGLVFILVFVLIRRYTGGHHAKTHFGCILTFNILLIGAFLVSSVVSWLQIANVFILILATLSLIGIFILVNAEYDGNRFRKASKIKSRWIAFILWIFCVFEIFVLSTNFGLIISLSMFSVLGGLAYAIIYKRGCILQKEALK